MRSLLQITVAFFFILMLQACNKDNGPFLPDAPVLDDTDTISYATQVQPIFDANCISCHNETHSKLDLRSTVSYVELLTSGFSASYVDTSDAEHSNIYLHLIGSLSIMPPSGALQDADKNLILLWINQGALNN